MSLVFVTNRVPMNSEKNPLFFDCFITCLNEGPFVSLVTPFIDYMSPIGI